MSVSVAPIHKKKSWKLKSARLEREDEKAGPSQREEEEDLMDEMETTRSLSLNELRDMQEDFSRCSEALCILGIDYLRRGYFKDPKGYQWAFGIAALETEEIKWLSTLPSLLEDPSVVGLLRVEEQQLPITTTTVHRRQYRTNRDSLIPIHRLIRRLESQGVISKTHSPFNSPIWPVQNGDWRLTVDCHGLNEVIPLLSVAVPDMLELQYALESKAAKWYATTDIANAFFSIPLAAECRPQFAFTWRGVQYTWNRLPQGWKHSSTICHGLIQVAMEQGEALEHLQYIDDIIVWGNTAEEVFEKGKKIVQILLKAGFAIKQSKVKGPAQEVHFLRIKWQDGRQQIPMDVINKRTAMSPPTSEKETQAFLGVVGFWRITESQNRIGWKRPLRSSPTVNLTLPRPPLYHVPKHLIQTSFKYLQGWRLNHFPGQPVPMLDNPFSEVKFPNIQSKPLLAQLEPISSRPITCYLGEETNPHLSTTSFQVVVVVESKKVSPQPPFLQAKQPQFPQLLLIRLLL
ncbi:hypothetical protein QYF61_015822 [Mycteria americana]|uniref:ribonuclease H n=1 Tax=Mycteria americana TaxID=33587 RepID=A0AAN7N650_MYCAM|nr:hypothetical protein QYF61_015822 [Mycteria americana]